MTRYQLPDTPEDIRRAKRAPIVAALFAASLCVGAMLMHPTFRTALGETLLRSPAARRAGRCADRSGRNSDAAANDSARRG